MCKNLEVGKISGTRGPVWLRDGRGVVQDEIRAVGSGQAVQGLIHPGSDLGL